jgi:hypothetical protein
MTGCTFARIQIEAAIDLRGKVARPHPRAFGRSGGSAETLKGTQHNRQQAKSKQAATSA